MSVFCKLGKHSHAVLACMLWSSHMLCALYILLPFEDVAALKVAPVQATPTGPVAVHASSVDWDSMLTDPEISTASGDCAQPTALTARRNNRVG